MDTSPGRVRSRGVTTDEEWKKLIAEGRCFKCLKQGHMARNCPTGGGGPSKARKTDNEEEGSVVSEGTTLAPQNKMSADDIISLISDADEEAKEEIIQKVFMSQDFS